MESTGLVTVISATIAGGGVIAAALITASRIAHQDDQRRRAEREQWRADVRLAAYTALLRATTVVVNRWWDLMDMLHNDETTDSKRVVQVHERVLMAWDDYMTSMAVVRMQGPNDPIADAADELRIWMKDFDRSASSVYRSTGAKPRNFSDFDKRFDSYRDVLQRFEQAAQHVLDSHI